MPERPPIEATFLTRSTHAKCPPIGAFARFREIPVARECVVGPGEVATLWADNHLQKGAGD